MERIRTGDSMPLRTAVRRIVHYPAECFANATEEFILGSLTRRAKQTHRRVPGACQRLLFLLD